MRQLRRVIGNRWVQWLVPLGILVAVAFLFRDRLHFIGAGFSALQDAHPAGIIAAILMIMVSFFAMSEVMHLLLRAGGTYISRIDANALTHASNAWSVTFPGGPAFAAVLSFQVQRQWGASVILCSWFFVLSSALSTMWLVILGIAGVFFLGADISLWSLSLTLAGMILLAGLVYWAAQHPHRIGTFIQDFLPRVNKLLRRDPQAGVRSVLRHIKQLDSVTLSLGQFGVISIWSLLNRLFDVATLWACVWAVTGSVPVLAPEADNTTVVGVLLAYVTAKIAGSVQATPGGLGPVEAALIATLVATGMTVIDATAVVIIYRLITLLLMAVSGWIIYFAYFVRRGFSARGTEAEQEDSEPEEEAEPASRERREAALDSEQQPSKEKK
ncbi:lysylphosphatidylglycerol synthase transmembrane domain-containing protein [Corynebacterium sp. A21]|uniref:lysylphosphatidylglycerol synthase transmembrane domain-containing protein n=1 Tax=Corynebacterium sp. A21 TaxID=3457318 RepID=UPI003FCEF934